MEKHQKIEFQNQLLALCRGAYLEGHRDGETVQMFNFEKTKTYKLIKNIKTPEEQIIKLLGGIDGN